MSTGRHLARMKPRRLLKEAQHLYRKKGRRLDEETRKTVQGAMDSLRTAMKSGAPGEIQLAKEHLYGVLAKQLPRTAFDITMEFVRALVFAVIIALCVRQFVIEPFRIPTGSMVPTLNVGDKILVTKFTYGLNVPFVNVKVLDFNRPRRWDVVVFSTRNIRDSSEVEKNFVKRVVGLPGETIEIRDGEIYSHDGDANGHDVVTHIVKPDYLKDYEPRYCDYQNIDDNKATDIELYETSRWLGVFPVRILNGETRTVQWKYGRVGQRVKVPPNHYFVLGDNSRDSFDSRAWGFVPFENIRGRVICKWKFLPPWGAGVVR